MAWRENAVGQSWRCGAQHTDGLVQITYTRHEANSTQCAWLLNVPSPRRPLPLVVVPPNGLAPHPPHYPRRAGQRNSNYSNRSPLSRGALNACKPAKIRKKANRMSHAAHRSFFACTRAFPCRDRSTRRCTCVQSRCVQL